MAINFVPDRERDRFACILSMLSALPLGAPEMDVVQQVRDLGVSSLTRVQADLTLLMGPIGVDFSVSHVDVSSCETTNDWEPLAECAAP